MPDKNTHFDAIIVGAGFAGIYMLHQLKRQGLRARVFEGASGVGGTWFWNRYPGARCDIPSVEYSYQFSDELQQEWPWTERYASQPEILRYLTYVVDKFALRPEIQPNTRVTAASFDEVNHTWSVTTDQNENFKTRFVILASGILSAPLDPKIKGLESFQGRVLKTSLWPEEKIDFTNRRVGIVGTGSSAIQAIPLIAEQARHLYVFQRTPVYAVPANNYVLGPEEAARLKAEYKSMRQRTKENIFAMDLPRPLMSAMQVSPEKRRERLEQCWTKGGFAFLYAFNDLYFSKDSNAFAADFVRQKIRGIVKNEEVAEALTPTDVFGCKRLCLENGYYETFNRPNVTLVNLKKTPLDEIVEDGIRTTNQSFPLEDLILATGFDAFTGPISKMDIRGRSNLQLFEKWRQNTRTYLGIAIAGFPNLFTITGPGSPSVLANVIPGIEQHVEWISKCLNYMSEHGMTYIEATEVAEVTWMNHVAEMADETIYPSCNSWYLGANVPGKSRAFLPYVGGVPAYNQKCNDVASMGYFGFELKP